MKSRFALVAAVFASAVATAAETPASAPPAIVEAVRMPAWIERDGARAPLAPGLSLRSNDLLHTGPDARVLLKLEEGSSVKLGENGKFELTSVGTREDNIFVATMKLLAGAFRFTTGAVARLRKREVSVDISTVTAGIRGTDLWGKAAADRDIVCVIEGRVEVLRSGEPAVSIDEPLSFYVAPKGRPALPVQRVNPAQLEQWANETEIAPGTGAARIGGTWQIVLASGSSEDQVFEVYRGVWGAGYPAELQAIEAQGKRSYEVRMTSLASEADANALAARLTGQYGVTKPRALR
jgi:hypothetical protein